MRAFFLAWQASKILQTLSAKSVCVGIVNRRSRRSWPDRQLYKRGLSFPRKQSGACFCSPLRSSKPGQYCSESRLALNRAVALRFRVYLLGLAAGSVNQRLAAGGRLAYEAADSGLLSPEIVAGISRVKAAKRLGARIGIGCHKTNLGSYWNRPMETALAVPAISQCFPCS